MLEHRYSLAELGWRTLKGADQGRAEALRTAACRLGFEVSLGMVRSEETWSAEELQYQSYARRYRWVSHAEVGPGDVELRELFESERYVELLCDVDGVRPSPGEGRFPFEDDELCPGGSLEDEAPDDFSYHEATGNEGATVERTYRRAAVVVWPPEHEVGLLVQRGTAAAAAALMADAAAGSPDPE